MTVDEFNIRHDYEIAVRNMNQIGWERMTVEEKTHDLQAIENYNAMVQDRLPATVFNESMSPGSWGYQTGNNIVVSREGLEHNEIRETTDTVFHEGSHVRDFQANLIPEIRAQYDPSELAARNTPVPDPNVDYIGYLNHPAEIAARAAGDAGVKQVAADREAILEADNLHNHPHNQILETYDYLALDPAAPEAGNVQTVTAGTGLDQNGPDVSHTAADSLNVDWSSSPDADTNFDAEIGLAGDWNADNLAPDASVDNNQSLTEGLESESWEVSNDLDTDDSLQP